MKYKQVVRFLLFTVFFSIIYSVVTPCMALNRSIGLVDVATKNGDSKSETFSVEHVLHVAGIPFVKYDIGTDDISSALQHAMIVIPGQLLNSTLSSPEKTSLAQYVTSGGILLSQRVSDPDLLSLFGISATTMANTRQAMTWNMESLDSSLNWFDDPLEQTIRFATESSTVNTTNLELAGSVPLAHFDDATVAVTKNEYGSGYAYLLGFSWKDLILRNQLNKDGEAQRSYSNGFEPTSDTIILFVRGIYESHIPYASWKHTSPYHSQSTLIITHDADSTSSMEMMAQFAQEELTKGVITTYNVTTHYLADGRLADFYNPYIGEIVNVINLYQKIGSHSVGHFPDFSDDSIIPVGTGGNTSISYKPFWNDTLGQTEGATVYDELEVSRNLLINDTEAEVWSFRSGHLAWNKYQIEVLDALGYKYDSSRSANDVLTNFPYRCLYSTRYSGDISDVYEIPLTISDIPFSDESTYNDMLSTWQEVTAKNTANHAPTVLLVHPNRPWKLNGQSAFIDNTLEKGILILDMDTYGNYWREREQFFFESAIADNVLTLTVQDSQIPLDNKLSIVIKNGKSLSDIVVQTDSNQPVDFRTVDWNKNSVAVSFRTAQENFVDIDTDQINDNWELQYFLNLTTSHRTSDFDKDGYLDLVEYKNDLAGEKDPKGLVYDPTIVNTAGGTGYHLVSESFLLLMIPSIISGNQQRANK